MDVARVNLAYLNGYEAQTSLVKAFAEVCRRRGCKYPLLVDLQGPSLRIGGLPRNEPVELKKGEELCITTNRHLTPTERLIFCDCAALPYFVHAGNKILINDGRVILTVKAIKPERDLALTPIDRPLIVSGCILSPR